MESKPDEANGLKLESIPDLVALDAVRAELKLHRSNSVKRGINMIWKLFNFDAKFAENRKPSEWVEYHYDDPRHNQF